MGSSRLPGKVIMDLAGKPLLARVVERAAAIPHVDRVILATTTAERDRPLLRLARTCGAETFAGSENDVLDRYYQAARVFRAKTIVRITADCPLLDPKVAGQVVRRFMKGDCDYVCNSLPPTFPDGLDTEVFSVDALERSWREADLPSEREHVTPYIRKNPEKFRVVNVENDRDLSDMRWTVDEAKDLEFARAVYTYLHSAGVFFGMDDVLKLLAEHRELCEINPGLTRNEGYQKSIREDVVVSQKGAQ